MAVKKKKMEIEIKMNMAFGSEFQKELFISMLETFMRALYQHHEYSHKNNRCNYLISRKEV